MSSIGDPQGQDAMDGYPLLEAAALSFSVITEGPDSPVLTDGYDLHGPDNAEEVAVRGAAFLLHKMGESTAREAVAEGAGFDPEKTSEVLARARERLEEIASSSEGNPLIRPF